MYNPVLEFLIILNCIELGSLNFETQDFEQFYYTFLTFFIMVSCFD